MPLTGPIFLPLENLNLCAEGFPAGCVNCVPVQKFWRLPAWRSSWVPWCQWREWLSCGTQWQWHHQVNNTGHQQMTYTHACTFCLILGINMSLT